MKRIFLFLFLFCGGARSEGIDVGELKIHGFGCVFDNFDYYLRTDLTKDDYIQNDSLAIEVFGDREKLFSKLVGSVEKYHFSRVVNSEFPEHYLDKVFFEFNGSRFTFYKAVGPVDDPQKVETRILYFCYEGDFDNELLDGLIPKNKLQSLDFGSDGVFYLIDDNDFHVVKFIKEKNKIVKIFIYGGYD